VLICIENENLSTTTGKTSYGKKSHNMISLGGVLRWRTALSAKREILLIKTLKKRGSDFTHRATRVKKKLPEHARCE